MAQPPEEDGQAILSIFPLPPPFYKHFTPTNLSALKDAKETLASESSNAATSTSAPASPQLTAANLLSLPAELREQLTYLIPPEPPSEETEYRVFGKPTKISGTDEFEQIMKYVSGRLWNKDENVGLLPLWEYERLYPELSPDEKWSSLDRQNYLFRFLRSILLKHIELLGSLAADPAGLSKDKDGNPILLREEPEDPMQPWGPKKPVYDKAKDKILREILTLSMNMHALINEYRPHQARETLIREMESQVERKKREIEGVKRMAGRVMATLEGFGEAVGKEEDMKGSEVGADGVMADEERARQREMWTVLDEILGF
ncbi:hypothetical protein CC80DRAFT_494944 [Byssothecium circinans]|uniref:Mediator of RNA polymerase II transcription subunit 7 n=1 Tax=Byssothecium circinans TaxID=147558 RepID=A0A6A5TMX5_9PLEO|nr:hypothetical protein CC80DRAFT_494944 [Byssothecium circinans]